MRLLIATPLYPPQLGGPAKYAKEIFDELSDRGENPILVRWGSIERVLPWGVRHFWYFLRVLFLAPQTNAILALDTSSVGFPTLVAAKLFGKKFLVRIGGDFLWEWYIERTGEMIKLSDFYTQVRKLTFKERLMLGMTRFVVRHSDVLLFNTQWQLDIWQKAYGFEAKKACVLENEYPPKRESAPPHKKVFVASGRGIKYKNISAFAEAFAKVKQQHPGIELDIKPLPPQENAERIAACYAIVVPSVSEVNSNFIIEALSYGKPFITSRDTGMSPKLEGLGIFTDTLDSKVLEGAIEELLDETKYQGYVERIKTFSYTHSWAQIVEELLATIKNI